MHSHIVPMKAVRIKESNWKLNDFLTVDSIKNAGCGDVTFRN